MRRMLGAVVIAVVTGLATAQPDFPEATPESVEVPREALERLDAVVRKYVEADEAVGAELLVIKNRRTIWHTTHGWADKAGHEPLQPGSIYCIRSMTKTLVGTAIQMLIDDGRLRLQSRASEFLPAYDTDTHRAITVQQLLEHRSGLHLSSLVAVNHKSLTSVQDVAGLAGASTLEFEPGADFNYSDDGTDTLTAIIEKVTGGSAEAYIQRQILDPLGMRDTILVVNEDEPRSEKMLPAYAGTKGAWTRFWTPREAPLFPYFLGSQSAYSTCADYARLLCLWADGGEAHGKRLLLNSAIERGLTPRSKMGYPCAYRGLEAWYGQLWQVWVEAAEDGPGRRIAFGHGGSDGTMAWCFPDQDLIIAYFTQSRGGTTVLSIEKHIDRLLIRGDLTEDAAVPARDTAWVEGIYWDDTEDEYWAIWNSCGALRAEIQAKAVLDLVPGEAENEWKMAMAPITLRFEEGAGSAAAVTVTTARGERSMKRIEPAADLPNVEDLAARVATAHGMDAFDGIVKLQGTLQIAGQTGPLVSLVGPGVSRTDVTLGGETTRILVKNGRVWTRRGTAPVEELSGDARTAMLMEEDFYTFGGWNRDGMTARVLARIEEGGRPAILVHLEPVEGVPCGVVIDEETGRVVRKDSVAMIPGLGPIGLTTRYEDFREVGGALFAALSTSEYVAVLGTSTMKMESMEIVEGDIDLFSMEAP